MVPVRFVGVFGKLSGRVHRDACRLHRVRAFRTQTSALPDLLFAAFDGADDHDGTLEEDRGILAAVCRVVRCVLTPAMVAGTSSVSEAPVAGCAGGAPAVFRS